MQYVKQKTKKNFNQVTTQTFISSGTMNIQHPVYSILLLNGTNLSVKGLQSLTQDSINVD